MLDFVSDFAEMLLGLSATEAGDLSAFQTSARAATVFAVLIFYVRIGKKRFLGEATALDAILLVVIGSIASRAISGTAPFLPSLAATFTLVLVHWLLSFLTRDWPSLSYALKGYDTVVIRNGKVDTHALRAAHMSDDDLAEDLREQGIDDLRKVKEARLERSGKLSVIQR